MQLEKTAFLPVPADEAFALVTEPERLRRWQTVSARVDLRAGGSYRWTVVPGHVAAGTFREVVPGKQIVFGWGWEGSPDLGPDASTVTVTLEPTDGGTLVRLVHDGLDEEEAASHAEGWTHFLERLEKAAAEGDAGPDEWAYAPAELTLHSSADATLAVLQQVLRGISAEDLAKPTPCTELNVGQLVDHLLWSLGLVGGMAGIEVIDSGAAPETRVADAAQQVNEAWAARGFDGTVQAGPNELPASVAGGILSIEYLVHAWDLAVATGQSVHVSDEVTAYVLDLAEQVVTPQVRAGGSFAEAVESPSDAHVLERLVAFTGRGTA